MKTEIGFKSNMWKDNEGHIYRSGRKDWKCSTFDFKHQLMHPRTTCERNSESGSGELNPKKHLGRPEQTLLQWTKAALCRGTNVFVWD